jgi:DHA1 family bicyclomycin/chloramphenicol resistance-like MFS transporter
MSDRFGRKPPLYVGLLLYVVASAAIVFVDDLFTMQLLRVLQALGGCAGVVVSRAVVRDRCDAANSARAFSLLTLVMGVAPILAPMLGSALLGYFSWRSIFVVLALVGLALMLAVRFGMDETVDHRRQAPLRLGVIWRQYGALFRHRQFLLFSLCGGLGSAGMFAYIAGSPFVLIELYAIEPARFAWVFGANALGLIIASQINGWLLARHWPVLRLLTGGLWLLATVSVVMLAAILAGFGGLWLLLLGFFLFMASMGFIFPNATAIGLASQGERAGTAAALMGTLQYTLGTLAGASMGLWHDGTALPVAAVMACCGVGAWLVFLARARHYAL